VTDAREDDMIAEPTRNLGAMKSGDEVHPDTVTARRRFRAAIVDEIDTFRAGRTTAVQMLNRTWAMFDAADFLSEAERDEFMDVYYVATSADDARQPYMPAGIGSDEEFEEAVEQFREWALGD
jgi:hypothetical protein